MNRKPSQKFSRFRFYVETGPASLFDRVRFVMGSKTSIKVDSPHFVRRVKERMIPEPVVQMVKNFNSRKWVLLSAEVRTDTGKFISSTWRCSYGRRAFGRGKRYYVVTIGLGDIAEAIYETAALSTNSKQVRSAKLVKPGPIYKFVETVNKNLMESQSDVKSHSDNMLELHNTKSNIHQGDDGWRISPFENIEQQLPVNVVKIDEWSRLANEIVKEPVRNWPERYADNAREFKKKFGAKDVRYYVRSLVNTADYLSDIEDTPVMIFMNGNGIEVADGWPGVLSAALLYLVRNRPEQLQALEISGLMGWIMKRNPKTSLQSSIESDGASVDFENLAALCRKLQWLLLMTGFNLDTVAIRFRRTDAKINEMMQALKAKKEDELRRKQLFEKKRSELLAKSNGAAVLQRGKGRGGSKINHAAVARESPYYAWRTSSGQVRFDQGTYIVQDGVVVFVKRHAQDADHEADRQIMRSNIDAPDEWKGFGVARPESDGMFGGIIQDDWID